MDAIRELIETGAITELVEAGAIRRLREDYYHRLDGRRLDELRDFYTPDAVCSFGRDHGGDWAGRDEIEANLRDWMNGRARGAPYSVVHTLANPSIRVIDPTGARGRWYVQVMRTTEGVQNPLLEHFIQEDVYQKREGRWLIHRTRIDRLWPKRDYHGPPALIDGRSEQGWNGFAPD